MDVLQFIHHERYHDAVKTQSLEDYSYNSFGREAWHNEKCEIVNSMNHTESSGKCPETLRKLFRDLFAGKPEIAEQSEGVSLYVVQVT